MGKVARSEQGRRIAHSYVGWAVGAGLIPFPMVDVASLLVLQMKMLNEIARVYAVPLGRERARTLAMSAVGGLAPQGVAVTGIPALLKFIPVVGSVLGVAVMPAAAAACTLALAEAFIRHLEAFGSIPDRPLPRLAHGQAAPAVAPPPVTPVPATPPPPIEPLVMAEPAASTQTVAAAAANEEPSDHCPDDRLADSGATDEPRTPHPPAEPGDDATPHVAEPVGEAAQPVRAARSAVRRRRRSPPVQKT